MQIIHKKNIHLRYEENMYYNTLFYGTYTLCFVPRRGRLFRY